MMMKSAEYDKNLTDGVFPIVVIGRQFGSGGRLIGKMVAERLGIDYFDSEILSGVAKRLGFSPHVFEKHEEKAPSKFTTLLQGIFGLADNFHDVSIGSERVYKEQSKIIQDICKKGPCVIVGRTADFIMRDHPGLVSVFLHSPLEKRAEAIIARGEAQDIRRAMDIAKKHDRERENYYNFYTGSQSWGKADNYSLSFDSSRLEAEEIAEIIVNCAQKKIKRQK